MKNNSLHITYIPGLSTKKTAQRFRSTSIQGAKKSLAKRNPESIKRAVFIDRHGNQTKLI